MTRPACPTCGGPIDRMRRSQGVIAAYPCLHWLTPAQAETVRDRAHTGRQ